MSSSPLAEALPGSPFYPARLSRLPVPPARLWWRGHPPSGDRRAVAVVGARAASQAACTAAHALGRRLAQAGVDVVSGGAYGIDAAAHQGALAGGGRTYAVLGCGVDVAYPDRHAQLFAQIATAGALVSEYPPGTKPRPGQFPTRNRLIAALADLVVMVEGAARSGALFTAQAARGMGIEVAAYPGSPGTGQLLRTGATEVAGADEVLEVLAGRRASGSARALGAGFGQACLPPDMHSVLAALKERPLDADGLRRRLDLPLPALMGLLGTAEIEGWIRRVPGGAYEVTRGH